MKPILNLEPLASGRREKGRLFFLARNAFSESSREHFFVSSLNAARRFSLLTRNLQKSREEAFSDPHHQSINMTPNITDQVISNIRPPEQTMDRGVSVLSNSTAAWEEELSSSDQLFFVTSYRHVCSKHSVVCENPLLSRVSAYALTPHTKNFFLLLVSLSFTHKVTFRNSLMVLAARQPSTRSPSIVSPVTGVWCYSI
jgi:hypothetical protein